MEGREVAGEVEEEAAAEETDEEEDAEVLLTEG